MYLFCGTPQKQHGFTGHRSYELVCRYVNASAYEFLQASCCTGLGDKSMEAVLKVISCMLGLYIVANGVWVVQMPPYGDEPLGYLVIAAGLFIPLLTLYVGHFHSRSYD
jgi:hypothetical protein